MRQDEKESTRRDQAEDALLFGHGPRKNGDSRENKIFKARFKDQEIKEGII